MYMAKSSSIPPNPIQSLVSTQRSGTFAQIQIQVQIAIASDQPLNATLPLYAHYRFRPKS